MSDDVNAIRQDAFETGVWAGLRAASVIAERNGSAQVAKAISDYTDQHQQAIYSKRRTGRVMIKGDIFLAMPLMTHADLYGLAPQPHAEETL